MLRNVDVQRDGMKGLDLQQRTAWYADVQRHNFLPVL